MIVPHTCYQLPRNRNNSVLGRGYHGNDSRITGDQKVIIWRISVIKIWRCFCANGGVDGGCGSEVREKCIIAHFPESRGRDGDAPSFVLVLVRGRPLTPSPEYRGEGANALDHERSHQTNRQAAL